MDKEFITWLEDVFSAVPDTSIRKMFGGVGLFRHGLMYALALSDGRIALKADDQTTQLPLLMKLAKNGLTLARTGRRT